MLRYIIIQATVFLLSTNAGFAESLEDRCESILSSLYESLPSTPVKDLADADFNRISKVRPCLKTYPWPRGLFYTETDDEDEISSMQMESLRLRIEELILEYGAESRATRRLKLKRFLECDDKKRFWGCDDETAKTFYYWSEAGWNHLLLKKYGYLLEVQKLLAEGKNVEAEALAGEAIEIWKIKAVDNTWDVGDENTYFSNRSLNNLLVLLHFTASAKVGTETLDAALSLSESYIEVRKNLRYEIGLVGDPIEELVLSTACF